MEASLPAKGREASVFSNGLPKRTDGARAPGTLTVMLRVIARFTKMADQRIEQVAEHAAGGV